MARDLLSSLTELTRRIRQEQASLLRAVARGREVCTGTDESGTITVLIDDEGTARDVRVAAGWRYRLRPEQVGPAVVAADASAALGRASATAEALVQQSTADTSRSTQDDPSAGPGSGDVGGPDPLVPPTGSATEAPRPRRSLTEISTAVLAAVDELDRVTEPPPPVQGTGAEGAVRVTLAAGRITECAIDQTWLVHQDEVTLAHALREAVSRAAAAGVATRARLIDYQRRLDALVADAQASLNHLAAGVRS